MNKSYTYKDAKPSASQGNETDTHLLVETAKAYSKLVFTWRSAADKNMLVLQDERQAQQDVPKRQEEALRRDGPR
jgi:hypothetical protein